MKIVEVEYDGVKRTIELGGSSMLNPGDKVGATFEGHGFVQATVISCEILPDKEEKPAKTSDDALIIGAGLGFTAGMFD